MKKYTLLYLGALIMFLAASCAKDEPAIEPSTAKLSKTYFWNPSTNVQTLAYQFTYNTEGRLTSAVTGNNDMYAPEFDAAGKLMKLSKTNPNGRAEISTFTYNGSGQAIKVVQTNSSGGNATGSSTLDYEYNAAGKISKSTATYTGGSSTVEYTWAGDNISESKSTNSSNTLVYTAKYVYDTKLSPYSASMFAVGLFFNAGPSSKNNITEITTTYGTVTNVQKRTYEYNTDGYAISMKLADGSNEGAKYEYVK